MEDKKMLQESLMKIRTLMNFAPGMTATDNKVVIKEDLEDPIGSDVNDIPEPSDVKEGDVTEKFDFVRDVVNKNKKKGKDDDDDDDDDKKEDDDDKKEDDDDDEKDEEMKEGEPEVKEDMFERQKIEPGGYKMAHGFVNESGLSNKETKRKNKQDRLDRKLGRK